MAYGGITVGRVSSLRHSIMYIISTSRLYVEIPFPFPLLLFSAPACDRRFPLSLCFMLLVVYATSNTSFLLYYKPAVHTTSINSIGSYLDYLHPIIMAPTPPPEAQGESNAVSPQGQNNGDDIRRLEELSQDPIPPRRAIASRTSFGLYILHVCLPVIYIFMTCQETQPSWFRIARMV